jgi:hypothetical protein
MIYIMDSLKYIKTFASTTILIFDGLLEGYLIEIWHTTSGFLLVPREYLKTGTQLLLPVPLPAALLHVFIFLVKI